MWIKLINVYQKEEKNHNRKIYNARTMTIAFKKLMKPLFRIAAFAKLPPTWPKRTRLGNSFKYKLLLYFFFGKIVF